jgi:hypothetical protein
VISVDGKGCFSVKDEISEMMINGNASPENRSTSTTITKSATGELLKIEGEHVDESVYRAEDLEVLVLPGKPVAPGSNWSFEIKENKETGAVAAKAAYTFVKEEKVEGLKTLKIKYHVKEAGAGGASTDGTIWVSKSDMLMVKQVTKWTNVPSAGAGAISGDLSSTLILPNKLNKS